MKEKFLHPVRVLRSWLEGFAEKPHAAVALWTCGVVEASLFPLPPDVLLIALCVTKPRRSILYSLLVVAGSSAGALLGYFIGNALYDMVGGRMLEFFGAGDQFQSVLLQYRLNAWLVLLLAGFTPIPFLVFTIAAGFSTAIEPSTLFFAALCGRVVRFVPIGVLLYALGPRMKYYLDQYLGRIVLALGLVLVLFLIGAKNLF